MKPTFSDWVERQQQIKKTFPDDLLEDLSESEPELYAESLACQEHISQMRPKLKTDQYAWAADEASADEPLPSILTKGWDDVRKHKKYTKNWADMENLLKLYALGLYFKDKPLTEQALYDKNELIYAVEKASLLFSKKKMTAEQRLLKAPTYQAFGQRVLRSCFVKDEIQRLMDLHEIDREVSEAYRGNCHHASKLESSRDIAVSVAAKIQKRYSK